jgi:hypothetical protein
MTVRQRIDQLLAEPPASDLGYPTDQRLVAGALLGLQLLADAIDARKAGLAEGSGPRPAAEPVGETEEIRDTEEDGLADVVAQLAELTRQVEKLTKAVKKSTAKRKRKPKN